MAITSRSCSAVSVIVGQQEGIDYLEPMLLEFVNTGTGTSTCELRRSQSLLLVQELWHREADALSSCRGTPTAVAEAVRKLMQKHGAVHGPKGWHLDGGGRAPTAAAAAPDPWVANDPWSMASRPMAQSSDKLVADISEEDTSSNFELLTLITCFVATPGGELSQCKRVDYTHQLFYVRWIRRSISLMALGTTPPS